MLEPLREVLCNSRIVLASASPRRKEILEKMNLTLRILPSDVEENLSKEEYKGRPHEFAVHTAEIKADNVFQRLQAESTTDNLIVIGSDTVVSCDGRIYGKPSSEDSAIETLSILSGRSHEVYTGVKIIHKFGDKVQQTSFYECTEVDMADLDMETIKAYVATKESMDKAGAYGIQAIGGSIVKGIKGDYFNVMGFPLHRFCVQLVSMLKAAKED